MNFTPLIYDFPTNQILLRFEYYFLKVVLYHQEVQETLLLEIFINDF